MWLYHRVMSPKDADRMANSVDPDQTDCLSRSSLIWVYTVFPSLSVGKLWTIIKYEPPHDKTNEMTVRPGKTQISLGCCPVWSESSLSAQRKLGPLATHWAQSENTDQTGRMPRLIWVFAGRTVSLLVLSCCGLNIEKPSNQLWN